MSFMTQFAVWYAELQIATQQALAGPLKDGLLQKIKEKADDNVYSYGGGGYRRGLIGDPVNMSMDGSGSYELHIKNITVQQGSPGRLSETDFVETGDKAFHQPYPRPFMDEALADYAHGEGPEDLANSLRSHGFIVT
ncbi:MAG: hypothetical protein IKF99_01400 [Oscillospiraceae bacterium]|nr:hypothetical protein [Oscillospiraceae bacterium]